ncbi:drug/metabolite transporter (DMT)-like permease [Paenibacillus taihuensis]|uniref:Drug/metabolite transporter (DMT)-like permease n=1 Tax=Paenibacillus taihuensis TaxID=1156355 RepID=A0A3D9RMQ2_9BACL|nr:DMT family transporter [Paenibacillus taihuensis]REE81179.1 drug/metabolite transporter (DMT)-like permease [Paenibacillus taihuensis]
MKQGPSSSSKLPVSPVIPLLIGMLAISFAPILVRYSHAPVSVQGMYRMLFTFVLMLPFGTKQLGAVRKISRKDWLLLVLAGIFLALHFLLWMASLTYTSIASSTILLALEPVFVMVGAYFLFRDRANKFAIMGMVIALIGAMGIGSGDIALSSRAFYGDMLSFLGALAVSINMLLAKQIMKRVSSYLYSCIVFGVTTICFFIYNVTMGISMTDYAQREWIVFLLLAIVPTVFGHLIFNWLLKYVKPTTISMSVLAEPVGASLLGMVLFSEMISGFQLVSGAFIIIGLILYMRAEKQPPPVEQNAEQPISA